MDLFFEEENCGRPETPSRMFFEFDGKRNIKIVVRQREATACSRQQLTTSFNYLYILTYSEQRRPVTHESQVMTNETGT